VEATRIAGRLDDVAVAAALMLEAQARLLAPGETIMGHLLGEGAIEASRLRLGRDNEAAALARGRAVPVARRVERATTLALAVALAETE
jgi:hypothetical protein